MPNVVRGHSRDKDRANPGRVVQAMMKMVKPASLHADDKPWDFITPRHHLYGEYTRRTMTSRRRRGRGRRRWSAGVAGAASCDAQTLAGRFGRGTRRVSHQAIHEYELAHFIFERRSQSLARLWIFKHGVKNKTRPWLQ
jgi:hypothetical protein